ncbi:hypothetical protein BSZ39_05110 [Bowdeniella nasicola]|uniref:Mechanosensitive ion channel MscS domain-containing protein n=1 Tax=Bowdeniella nasicola TaxID=208480 RepID=A0A1Q5Q371_9ACTO|nr:mechanosensitive ion channel family protein [Bowdeniella nasicola]OKL54278.1 hypothetical protein BSZ39_05110 [Bowdeniella nasicola]
MVPTDKTPAEDAAEAAIDVLTLLGFAGIGLAIAVVAAILIGVVVRVLSRRRPALGALSRHSRRPFQVVLALLGIWLGVLIPTTSAAGERWRILFDHGCILALIAAVAWLLISVVAAIEDMVVSHHKARSSARQTARVKTQMQVLRRVGSAVIVVCAIAGAMLTFEGARAIGASLFASAGLISVVAGLAAQSSLTNVFAGMQIAFSDAIRVDDLVQLDGQTATIEEITLTYVVARTWDDRRLILPSTRFTTQPFENWTRLEPKLLGTVEIDLDWLVPVEALRAELMRIVSSSDLWDGRSCGLQVTEATDARVRVRAVVSAANLGDLWDLRCAVREQLVSWLQSDAPYSLPRTRVETKPYQAPSLEEREAFNRERRLAWERESAERRREADDTIQMLDYAVQTEDEFERKQRQEAARRARRRAEKADRRASRLDKLKLGGGAFREPVPSAETTRVLTGEDLASLQAALEDEHPSVANDRLYSGSKDAEERAELMKGPSEEEMAERVQSAERRKKKG